MAAIETLDPLGMHTLRMSEAYIQGALERTGSVNLVTGVLFDFRAYDTLGEAVILYTAALGALTLLRMKGTK
jgi:multicomponent Na+:H+ antiporter subunit A